LKKSAIRKFLKKISLALALITAIFAGMLLTNSGRDLLLNWVAFFLKTQGVTFAIDKLDDGKNQKISVHLPNGTELSFSDLGLKEKHFLDGLSICVDSFFFSGAAKKSDPNAELQKLIPLMRKIKFFVKDFSLKKCFLRMDGRTYLISDLIYNSQKNEDFLSGKIDEKQCVTIVLKWENCECVECVLKLNSVGNLKIKYPERKITKYQLTAKSAGISVISNGSYENFMSDVKIDGAEVSYLTFDKICFFGNLYPSKRNAVLKAEINLEQLPYFNSTPSVVADNFKDVRGYLDVNFDFATGLKHCASAVFKKSNATVGVANCVHENGETKIDGNIGWISVFGFDFSNFRCEINKKKEANINLCGKDFEIISNIKFGDCLAVEKFELKSPKGFLKSSNQFFITGDLDCSFDFNFNRLDFWNKILPISGSGSGSFVYKNKKILGRGNFPRLMLKDSEFYSADLSSDGHNFQVTSKSAQIFGAKLANLELKVSDRHLNLSSRINKNGVLKASGEISESFKKISMNDCTITFPHSEIKLETLVLDSILNNYKLRCAFFEGKKLGKAEINFSDKETMCRFNSFPVEKFMKLFNRNFLTCKLNGDLELKSENGNFVGNGKLSLANFIASKQILELCLKVSNGGTKIDANLKNNRDLIEVSAFLPVVLKNNGTIFKIHNDLLNCRVTANAKLERILELPDNSDLHGDLNCDFRITGSFINPIIFGKAELQKASISVGAILLKNGIISLIGNGKSIDVLQAEFTDYKKKKARVSGNGKLFFDGIAPNINTNLRLKFDSFTLFDSDDLKIDIKGEGSMSGPIDDMIIRGDVNVTRCQIQDFNSEEDRPNFLIENDPYMNSDGKTEQNKKDFFKYYVSMHCKDVKFTGNIFEMHLGGDLLLSTFRENGTLIGELNLFDGRLDLFGKRMKFANGKVTFLEEFPFNPKASFKCKKNFGDMGVALDIKNNPSKGVSIKLHSTPSYTQDVILSRMLFGKELKYLTVTEAAQLAHVVAGLNRRGYIFSVLNTFQNTGVVDNISFASTDNQSNSLYSNSQSASFQNNVSVSAGKYIHDNVYISVNKKNEGASFDIDFSLTPQISVKANTMGEAGIGWKYRY
jgi:hypothetical protein